MESDSRTCKQLGGSLVIVWTSARATRRLPHQPSLRQTARGGKHVGLVQHDELHRQVSQSELNGNRKPSNLSRCVRDVLVQHRQQTEQSVHKATTSASISHEAQVHWKKAELDELEAL